ncbi:putative inactive peptidyl-prolyl cis-trans isomerase-like 6, partial [Galemys pyrenaicus]
LGSAAMASLQPGRPRSAACRSKSPPEKPLQVKVVGLFKSSSFQIAKNTAEGPVRARGGLGWNDRCKYGSSPGQGWRSTSRKTLKIKYPSKFQDPILVPLQEFAWQQYLQEKKRELKNEVWVYSSFVMCFVNDQLLGDALDLQKWAHKIWDIVDFKPPALYEALTLDYSTKFLRDTKARKAGFSESGIRLHYTGSIFHRIVQNGWIQGGDIVAGKGDGGESIYGPTFEDENFSIPHNKRGILGMVNKGRHSNGSQFYITLQSAPYLDRKYVAFGQLIEGTDVLEKLESVPTQNERPIQQCMIIGSGDLYT